MRPILTSGDVVGGTLGGYQMSGIPDGIGAYRSGPDRIEVLFNHELDGSAPAGVGARVSQVTIDGALRVTAARYLLDGSESFLRFCSSTLATIDGVPWYFTGEESIQIGKTAPTGRGGSSIALNALTGRWYETRHLRLFDHENVVPVQGLKTAMLVSGEDGPADRSQLYAYTAPTFGDAVKGDGQLWVWAVDRPVADGDPSNDDVVKGQTLSGHFVPLSQQDNATADTLEAAAQAEGAFDFTRIEDVAVSEAEPGLLYFADTGSRDGQTRRGRIFQLRIDPRDPTRAALTLLLDGDHGDDVVNPDNLDTSRRVLVVDEDRNNENRGDDVAGGYGWVLVYDLAGRRLTSVAQVATVNGKPGEWEPTGVLDAAPLLGRDWWLVNVQAHTLVVPQPGPDLEVGSGSGEGGQLLAVRIPGST